jgi:hypothetical protein
LTKITKGEIRIREKERVKGDRFRISWRYIIGVFIGPEPLRGDCFYSYLRVIDFILQID